LTFPLQEAPVEKTDKTGSIVGEIIAGVKTPPVNRPVRVTLLNETYTNLYDAETLHRIDDYWERFKPAFVENKELFFPISQVAQTEALELVLSKRRQDGQDSLALTVNSTPDGRFEFRNVPLGEYKIVAFGAVGANEFVWQGWVNLEASEPVRVQLKTTLP
jgi:hypothetical protein